MIRDKTVCGECGRTAPGHSMMCSTGNRLAGGETLNFGTPDPAPEADREEGELLPCRVSAGHRPQITKSVYSEVFKGKFYSVVCSGCCSTSAHFMSPQNAVERWNTIMASVPSIYRVCSEASGALQFIGREIEALETHGDADLAQLPDAQRCDVSVTGKHRIDTPYCKDCGKEFLAPTTEARRCIECDHSGPRNSEGRCMVDISAYSDPERGNQKWCMCKCEFAATGGESERQDGVSIIAAERQRHFTVEGWTPEHDDEHEHGELAVAAACYAVEGTDARVSYPRDDPEGSGWPWGEQWWKPKDDIRNLARAGALIAAEIDRLQRQGVTTPSPAPEAAGEEPEE